MSRPAVVLASVSALTAGVIAFVHYNQKWQKERMYAGVLRDIERENARKAAKGESKRP
ncbi:hypothetical protein JKP88DRAFT_227687 [Tribonema minus]|uniref:Uncharacterized protein n=1 Tax=Tribonema minus TaxID=303371 RepID=A0A836C8M9_9STRA|nr:hypothetical protein JKP88DRAFT_227687 [Tribonema minus]